MAAGDTCAFGDSAEIPLILASVHTVAVVRCRLASVVVASEHAVVVGIALAALGVV